MAPNALAHSGSAKHTRDIPDQPCGTSALLLLLVYPASGVVLASPTTRLHSKPKTQDVPRSFRADDGKKGEREWAS